ncbi:unnamed protein product [Adineta ricciae]|uniref:Uncharacterized protein n=1 Tax=Adineta ricciae TaxID=249248 RepID=A0A815T8H4_ADIRI|nr:unnamed protein product [Adineta ricciae]CAF1596093.1 unnamed protein product [Adineta ricciae]
MYQFLLGAAAATFMPFGGINAANLLASYISAITDGRSPRADRYNSAEPPRSSGGADDDSDYVSKFINEWRRINPVLNYSEIIHKAIEGILEEAAPLKGKLQHDELSPEEIAAALRRVQHSSERDILECVVTLYTRETFLCYSINFVLRYQMMEKVQTLGPICFLLQHYLLFFSPQVPISDSGKACDTVYRGVCLDSEGDWRKLIDECQKLVGTYMRWPGFTSTSKDINVSKKFMACRRYQILYTIRMTTSVKPKSRRSDISPLAENKRHEKEVLFSAGCQFLVQSVEHGNPTKILLQF